MSNNKLYSPKLKFITGVVDCREVENVDLLTSELGTAVGIMPIYDPRAKYTFLAS